MLKTTLLTLTAIVSAVLAGSVDITSPQQGEVWEAGKEVDIVWDAATAGNSPVSIMLASGPAKALLIDMVVANKIPASQGHYKWTVPSNLKSGKNYVIEVGPNMKDISFAGYITVKGVSVPSGSHVSHHPSATHSAHHSHHTSASASAHHAKAGTTALSQAPPHSSAAPKKHHHKKAKKSGKKSPKFTTIKIHPKPSHAPAKPASASV
ncbi:hypothetical protein INT43_002710 [Umbelopsis isabellina]|uniref:Yeast cell wall synthesis Kre9/Knh1-like N-terminal domain-containing protein n=1 Tax=Mortierella isabellina TaxID=91625 RepID=A0A8H7Q5D3_MORIS|nr:hypothetical protein INT43_002710 [Umbelopsis isabellina]